MHTLKFILFAAVTCAARPQKRSVLMHEIIATANFSSIFSNNMEECKTFVPNVFENTKNDSVFCKAAKVLSDTSVYPPLRKNIKKLYINLRTLSSNDCTVEDGQYSETELYSFLKSL